MTQPSGETGLEPLFAPRSVALIGAHDDSGRAGGRLVDYMTGNGYGGRLYFVNPSRSEIRGHECLASVTDAPEPVDLALIALGARRVEQAVRECGEAGVRAAVVFATGFAEIGGEGVALQRRLAEVREQYGLRLLGPNTAGVRATAIGLFGEQGTNLGTVGYRAGSVAMISQSGALGGYFGSTYLKRLGVGTRYFVDTGNELDVDAADCLEHISRDPAVSCVTIVLESSRDGRKLAAAVRAAVGRGKPVLFLKVGRTGAGVEAAQSHTGAMASSAELLEAELAAAGAFVTRDEPVLADAMLVHETGSAPPGNRLGIVTPSGGFGVLALDLAEENGLTLPEVAWPEGELAEQVAVGTRSNPLEVAGLAAPGTELLGRCLGHMGAQAGIDAVVLWHPHRLLLEAEQDGNLEALRRSRDLAGKPYFHCGMTTPAFSDRLRAAGILSFDTPTRLMRTLAAVTRSARGAGAQRVVEPPADLVGTGTVLTAAEARRRLQECGLELVETVVLHDAGEALACQDRWGRPVILKLESYLATHKTEHGLVRGPLAGKSVAAAYEDLASSPLLREDPGAVVVAQPFETGIELALGAHADPSFGPSVMVAHGGTWVEALRDAAFAAAPVDPERAAAMLAGLRIYPALAGSRGTRADLEAVVDALVALSRLVAGAEERSSDSSSASGSRPRLSIDVNPLIVRRDGMGAVAVDARIVVFEAEAGAHD